jgi:hypothetical protein
MKWQGDPYCMVCNHSVSDHRIPDDVLQSTEPWPCSLEYCSCEQYVAGTWEEL